MIFFNTFTIFILQLLMFEFILFFVISILSTLTKNYSVPLNKYYYWSKKSLRTLNDEFHDSPNNISNFLISVKNVTLYILVGFLLFLIIIKLFPIPAESILNYTITLSTGGKLSTISFIISVISFIVVLNSNKKVPGGSWDIGFKKENNSIEYSQTRWMHYILIGSIIFFVFSIFTNLWNSKGDVPYLLSGILIILSLVLLIISIVALLYNSLLYNDLNIVKKGLNQLYQEHSYNDKRVLNIPRDKVESYVHYFIKIFSHLEKSVFSINSINFKNVRWHFQFNQETKLANLLYNKFRLYIVSTFFLFLSPFFFDMTDFTETFMPCILTLSTSNSFSFLATCLTATASWLALIFSIALLSSFIISLLFSRFLDLILQKLYPDFGAKFISQSTIDIGYSISYNSFKSSCPKDIFVKKPDKIAIFKKSKISNYVILLKSFLALYEILLKNSKISNEFIKQTLFCVIEHYEIQFTGKLLFNLIDCLDYVTKKSSGQSVAIQRNYSTIDLSLDDDTAFLRKNFIIAIISDVTRVVKDDFSLDTSLINEYIDKLS